jgi:hypothetical protein
LKKRTNLGSSSSWDSRPVISIRSTDPSTVATIRCIRCCEHNLNCSGRPEPTNLCVRSRKGCQWSRICWVTLNCEKMTATPVMESELSSHKKEASKRRLTCGRDRESVSS